MTRGRVLSIDDESMVTQAVRRLLAQRYQVATVDDAKVAFGLLQSGARFDAIICDVFMPLMNGMDFYEKVRALDPDQAARIVFLTGASTQQDVRAFLAAVPNRRLDKPFSPLALEAVIDDMMPVVQ